MSQPIVVPQQKPNMIVIHPLVLLSVVDHYNRYVENQPNKRVVGALLGERKPDGIIDVSNCYAIPFEEDPKDPNIWFLDHIYNETLYDMYKKININENIVGWYTTGARFKPNDIQINQIFYKYNSHPIFVVIDVHQQDPINLPTEAYIALEEVTKSGEIVQTFHHLPSTVQAIEPEEIGVEQLLREINTATGQSLTSMAEKKVQSLQGLLKKIQQIQKYLRTILENKVQPNTFIINQLQEILNHLPNLVSQEIIQVFTQKNNDNMNAVYIATMVRSVIALHNLINNQISNKELEKVTEKEQAQKKEEKKEEKKAAEQKEKKEEKKD